MEKFRSDNILYELFVYGEWKSEPDLIQGEVTSLHQPKASYLLKYLKPEQTLVESISNYVDQLQPWLICLGNDGKVIALLQDSVLEIRSKRANYSTIVARAGVLRDPYPQWRKMAWSPDCSILAVAHSNGKVSFYDLMATNIFNILPECSQPPDMQCNDTTHAVSAIIYLGSRIKDRKWSSEVLISDYRGLLRSFLISSSDGCKFYHKFNFEGGVSTITYHSSHNMIFVTGLPSCNEKDNSSASGHGIRGWRLLNDSPFYKPSLVLEKEKPLTSWIYNPLRKSQKQSIITRAVASPDGSLLACTHLNGSISLWQLPTLRYSRDWPIELQTGYNVQSTLSSTGKHRVWPVPVNEFSEYSPIDINWWTDSAVIVSRLNGSVTICSVVDLHNMLRDSPEFLQGHPQITSSFDGGFLSLECEASLVSAKKSRQDSDSDDELSSSCLRELSDNEALSDSANERFSFVSRITEFIKSALYAITDMERFQPKPKKLNLLSRVYRLLCLKSTTPEDLYSRKIENGDYSEALVLAHTFGLDTDLVYQQQWRSSRVSHQTIRDYLSKVSKKVWTIQQCCDRIPETLDGASELLKFGLQMTNVEILKDALPGILVENEKLLEELTVDSLSARNVEILRYRNTMFFYLDRLEIYKAVIQSESPSSSYSMEEYNRLRCNTVCRSAVEFAKEGRVKALTQLWPHCRDLSARLIVLQNLPETLSPVSYKTLLPKQHPESDDLECNISIWRQTDWCEKHCFSCLWNADSRNEPAPTPPARNLTEWYCGRARELEWRCGLVRHSLALITLASDGGVGGLEELHSQLLTLEALVYNHTCPDMTLARLESCSQSEVFDQLMSGSTASDIIANTKNVLFPYLERCEKLSCDKNLKRKLFDEYFISLCGEDLTLPLEILQRADVLGLDTAHCLGLAEMCFMAQSSAANASSCFRMIDYLPKESDGSVAPSNLVRSKEEMDRLLKASLLLYSHNVHVTFGELKLLIKDPATVKFILTRMARNAANRRPTLNAEEWNELLTDILELHSKVFCCIDIELCYEIFALSMLSSADKMTIRSAEDILTYQKIDSIPLSKHKNKFSPQWKKIPFHRSVELVLESAREYLNSATSFTDPVLQLSWTCLQIIKDDVPEIQYERDLICALKILEEFELGILPIQVRFYNSKIGLIEDCLHSNNKSYKSVEKFTQLAKLLRIFQDDDKRRELTVVSLCAERALESEDYGEAARLSWQLLSAASGAGAAAQAAQTAAARLGGAPSRTSSLEPALRLQLLALSLLHCAPSDIETLLRIKSSVEFESIWAETSNLSNLARQLRRPFRQDVTDSSDEDFSDAVTSPTTETEMAETVRDTYRYTSCEIPTIEWGRSDVQVEKSDNKLYTHPFYSNQQTDCNVSYFTLNYDKFYLPEMSDKRLALAQALTRSHLLQDSLNDDLSRNKTTEAILEYGRRTVHEDTALFISLFLCVYYSSSDSLQSVPLDSKNKNSLLYLYALINELKMQEDAFSLRPLNTLLRALSVAEAVTKEQRTHGQVSLLQCRDRYTHFMEEEKINLQFGSNINIDLFKNESKYRKMAIVNLMRLSVKENSLEKKKLVMQYARKELEIALGCISYVISEHESVTCSESFTVIADPDLLSLFTSQGPLIFDRFHSDIWKSLDGRDHQGLILYYTLLNKVNNNHTYHGLNAKEHLKTIKKCKSACSELDYKLLLEHPSRECLEEHVIPSLTPDNVGVVIKLLRTLPSSLGIDINASNLYRRWLLKFFFNVAENSQSKMWMRQYRECSGYFSKLTKEDILSFSKEIIFGSVGLIKLAPKIRIQIAYQTAEACHHEHTNNDNLNLNIQEGCMLSWKEIGDEIERWASFLDAFHSDNVRCLIESSVMQTSRTWRDVECSRGVKGELLEPLKDLLCDNNLPARDLQELLHLLGDVLTLDEIILHALQNDCLQAPLLCAISKRLMNIKRENIELSEKVLEKVKYYSTSPLLSSLERLSLMSFFKIDQGDTEMTEQLSKEMILSNWNEDDFGRIADLQIADPVFRSTLFIKLISKEESWEKLKILVDLISMWPSTSTENPPENPCCILIVKLLLKEEKIEEHIPLLKLLMDKYKTTENDIKWIIYNNNINNPIGKIWLCLSSEGNIHRTILIDIITETKDIKKYEVYLEDSLLNEILKNGLLSSLVKTSIYPKLVQRVISSLESTPETGILEVPEAVALGVPEVGALQLALAAVPAGLRSFSQSLRYRRR